MNPSEGPKVLLLQTKGERGSFWQNVTGSVEEKESFLEAAQRELFEETSFKSPIYDLEIEDHFIDRKNLATVERIFYSKIDSKMDPLLSNEHQSFVWRNASQISPQDYKYLSNFKAFSLALKALLKKE